jgi:hypothetical protein
MRFLVRQRRRKRETREKGILEKRSLLCAKPSLSSEPGAIEGKREFVSPPEGQMTQPPSSHRAAVLFWRMQVQLA